MLVSDGALQGWGTWPTAAAGSESHTPGPSTSPTSLTIARHFPPFNVWDSSYNAHGIAPASGARRGSVIVPDSYTVEDLAQSKP